MTAPAPWKHCPECGRAHQRDADLCPICHADTTREPDPLSDARPIIDAWICIVHGCRNRAIACCYSRHGRHAYCVDHDFARTGMAHPYHATPPPQAPVEMPTRPTIGPQAPVRPLTPPRAPTPQDGARAPIVRPPVPHDLMSLEF